VFKGEPAWRVALRKTIIIAAVAAGVVASQARAQEATSDFFRMESARLPIVAGDIAFAVRASPGSRLARPAPSGLAPSGMGGGAIASWYGGGEKLARHTASGQVFRPHGFTAAHRTLPLGTRLLVSANGRSVMVRVNDRGPAAWTGRSLDLSRGAAQALGMLGAGTARVTWRVA
jgi:rare lipoprotein A